MSIHLDDDPAPAVPQEAGSRRHIGRPARCLVVLTLALLLALVVRVFLVQAFFVPSPGMAPSVRAGDRVLVVKAGGPPARGDVVVADVSRAFAGPSRATPQDAGLVGRVLGPIASALGVRNGSRAVISRVVAVAGDEVAVTAGDVRVNGKSLDQQVPEADLAAFTVPAGHVWLLGDNHRLAIDSLTNAATAEHGAVPVSDVVGRAWLRYWPLDRLGLIGESSQGEGS